MAGQDTVAQVINGPVLDTVPPKAYPEPQVKYQLIAEQAPSDKSFMTVELIEPPSASTGLLKFRIPQVKQAQLAGDYTYAVQASSKNFQGSTITSESFKLIIEVQDVAIVETEPAEEKKESSTGTHDVDMSQRLQEEEEVVEGSDDSAQSTSAILIIVVVITVVFAAVAIIIVLFLRRRHLLCFKKANELNQPRVV